MKAVPCHLRRFSGACLSGILACLSTLQTVSGSDSGSEAADRLWSSFIEKYNEFSLHPLDEKTLDERARTVLISTAGSKFKSWKPDSKPTFLALANAIMDKDASVPKFERIENTLTALLPTIDTYGYYKSASDIAQWREALRQNPGSVHMTLDLSTDGRILCYPLPDGPAEGAGINFGSQLLAVDQRSVEGKTLSALRLAFVGPPNSPITLTVKQPQGKIEDLTITRADKESPIVSTTKSPVGLTVRVRKFDIGSSLTIKQQLEPYPKPGRLTLDLRGNAGGLREEALKTASMFFAQGTPLGKFATKNGAQTANDGNGVLVEPASIQILQDGRTASAAEYLIAILKEGLPDHVTLFGKKTYGKSHSTVHVALEGGGELAVTEALLSTASGRSWDKSGIPPDQDSSQ